MRNSTITIAGLKDRLGGRPLYLWGASQVGVGLLHALRRSGIEAAGFLDSRKTMQQAPLYGKLVHHPAKALNGSLNCRSPFIINSTFQHKDEISKCCSDAGLLHDADYISYDELCPVDYQVVISSVCNLRCISCPLGNMPERLPGGMMNAATYEQVIEKVLRETPLVAIIQLYNWGEPLLNPELPEIIRMTNERNVLCAVSSNLSLERGFDEVIRARPGCFRVSVSGWGDSYAETHSGGDWERVHANMHRLRELRSLYCPEMPVEVTYHIYNNNRAEAERVRRLCEKLEFSFRPHLAALLPLDNVVAYRDGEELSVEARRAIDLLALPIGEAIQLAGAQSHLSCNHEHALNIYPDLTVKHCGLYYGLRDNIVTGNYLDTPIDEIMKRRKQSNLCFGCRAIGLHQFCRIYTETSGLEIA